MGFDRSKVKSFSVNRDGLNIGGRIYGKSNEVRPAVILCHGFMANQSMCRGYAKFLAQMGYVSFTFDFCGGGVISSSDGKTSNMSIFTELKDLESVFDYVSACPFVDNNRISLLGCSQGGTVAALFAKKFPNRIDKLLLFYPALCIPDDARKGKMVFAKFNPNDIPDKFWCGPMKLGRCYVETVKNMDIYDEIDGFSGKVFLIHGTHDKIVDIAYSRKAKEIYSDVVYWEITGGAHVFRGKSDEEARDKLKAFMR